MKISELIAALEREQAAHGDIEVKVSMDITESVNHSYVVDSRLLAIFIDGGQLALQGSVDY